MSVNYMQGGELVQVAGNTDAIPNGEKGKPGGVATLDSEGKIPESQIPSKTEEVMCAGRNGYIAYPEDGYFNGKGDSIKGFLKIVLPVSYTDTMIKFTISIFNYRTNEAIDYHISGYNFTEPKWRNCTAVCVGKMGVGDSNLTVRFGTKGDKCAITIGEGDHSWSYAKAQVHDILIAHSNAVFTLWKSGWQVSIDPTPLDKVDATISNTHVAYNGELDNVVNRRNTYRGKNLGTSFTDEQKAAIRSGTFTGLYVGDYWLINNIKWRIVDINYWLGTGDVNCSVPHLLIMPDGPLYNAKMNNTNTTIGGYPESVMRTTNLEQAKTMINAAFAEEHILNHKELLMTDKSNDGHPNYAWYDSTVELPNEIMMYGSHVYAAAGEENFIPHLYTIDKTQLALMRLYPAYMNLTRSNLWLRDMVKASYFCYLSGLGQAAYHASSGVLGVRPVFGLIG